MNKFIQFFECGNVNLRIKDSRCDFYVQDFNKIYNNIIPHFDSYPLQNIKHLDFADFKKAAELYKTDSKKNGEALKFPEEPSGLSLRDSPRGLLLTI